MASTQRDGIRREAELKDGLLLPLGVSESDTSGDREHEREGKRGSKVSRLRLTHEDVRDEEEREQQEQRHEWPA